MNMEQINTLSSFIDVRLFYLLFQILFGIFILTFSRDIINTFIGFIMFKSNKYVCIGRKVIVNDFKGHITHIGFQFIVIKNGQQVYLVQTSRWRFEKWKFDDVEE